jgi:hypothetical protein
MSTKITAIKAALESLVTGQLTEHNRLDDPYHMDANPENLLRLGWGVKVDDGRNTKRTMCPTYTLARNFSIVVTREALGRADDAARREAAQMLLLEDLHLLMNAAAQDITLGGNCFDLSYQDDTGIQEVFIEQKPFNYIEATFSVEYFQSVA